MKQENVDFDGEILHPSVLIIGQCDLAGSLENEQGYLTYCNAVNKLGFITETGVGGELITSA